MMPINMEPIGHVTNDIDSPTNLGWAKVESKIILDKNLALALSELTDSSHIIVLFWMHRAEPPAVLQRRPQNREDMPESGLLSQRQKHHPNPVGITIVPLINTTDNGITVRGLDTINDTLMLDIKPYYPQYDNPGEVKIPEWVNRLTKGYF